MSLGIILGIDII